MKFISQTPRASFTTLDVADLELVAGGAVGAAALVSAATAGSPLSLDKSGRVDGTTSKLMEALHGAIGNGAAMEAATGPAAAHSDTSSAVSATLDTPSAALPGAMLGEHANGYLGIVSSMGLNDSAVAPVEHGGCHHHQDEG